WMRSSAPWPNLSMTPGIAPSGTWPTPGPVDNMDSTRGSTSTRSSGGRRKRAGWRETTPVPPMSTGGGSAPSPGCRTPARPAIGDHGFLDHKMSVFQELLNVPLVVRYPAAVESGQRSAEPVMLQDVYATLLGLVGVPVENAPDGGDRRESIVLPGIRGLRCGG